MYINTSTKEILGLGALRKLLPKTAFPSTGPDDKWLADSGKYARFVAVPAPVITDNEVAVQSGAELIAGIWQTKWTVRAKTLEEKTAAWQSLMNATDREMPRSVEDILSNMTAPDFASLSIFTRDRYEAKIALRADKPV